MHLLCVIPARLGSTRLPQKPLRPLGGEPLIRVVARRALELGLAARVVVAGDDPRILEAVAPLGVEAVLTDRAHRSGTERVAEVARRPEYRDAEIVLNLQGDEPLIPREAALGAVRRVEGGAEIGTAADPLQARDRLHPDRVKVAVDAVGRALDFFRTPQTPACGRQPAVFRHVGVYAYRPAALERWIALPPVAEEIEERLEQLRPLRHGMTIGVEPLRVPAPPGVDSEEDLRLVEAAL